MSRILNCLTGLLLLSCLTLPLMSQDTVQWETDLKTALARSKSENKPLLITMHTTTEVACQRMLKNLYTNADVMTKLKDFIVLPTCFGPTNDVEKKIDGRLQKVSPLFRTIDGETLRTSEAAVRAHFFDKAEVKVPNHIFVGVDGTIYMQKIYELKKPAFVDLLDRALVQFGSKVVDGMDEASKKLFLQVRKGKVKEKQAAVKAILDFQDEKKADLLYMTIQGLSKETDRAYCIRAMGTDSLSHAAPIALKWLADKSSYIKNCAVVTLEEMVASEAAQPLISLYGRTKKRDKGLRKDILRALGPCAAGESAAKKILLSHVKDRDEPTRLAAYMSLGNFLDEEDVQKTLQARFKKDSKGVAARTAILYAYMQTKNSDLAPQVDAMIKGEKNGQIKAIAGMAKKAMGVEDPDLPVITGKGRRKVWSPLYTKDKIVRNKVARWRSY